MEYSTEAKGDELTALLLLMDGVAAFVGESILPLQSLLQRPEIVHVFSSGVVAQFLQLATQANPHLRKHSSYGTVQWREPGERQMHDSRRHHGLMHLLVREC